MKERPDKFIPLSEAVTVPPQLIGAEGLMMPMPDTTSSQRTQMVASEMVQALCLDNAERPLYASGWERRVGRYTFDRLCFDEEAHVLGSFTRCSGGGGSHGHAVPSITVVYCGVDSDEVSFFEITSHVNAHGSFGWQNRWINQEMRQPGARIPAGEEVQFQQAPNQDDEDFIRLGVNVNCAYITHWAAVEDAFIISDEQAERMTYTQVDSVSVPIRASDIPINMYGDETEYKVFPNIGETVADDGVLMAIRKGDNSITHLSDLTDSALSTPFMHDRLIKAPAGAEIVDVHVYLGSRFNDRCYSPVVYEQFLDYHRQNINYHRQILELWYNEVKPQGYKISDKFATLLEESIEAMVLENWLHGVSLKGEMKRDLMRIFKERGSTAKRRQVTTMDGKDSIEFARVEIVYAYKTKPGKGSKMVGRWGDKGVVSEVWPKRRMPIDSDGVQADAVFCPTGVPNRMNVGQLTETYLGRASMMITESLRRESDEMKGWNLLMEYLYDVLPEIAQRVEISHPNNEARADLVDEIRQDGLHSVIMLPYRDSDYDRMILDLAEKWGVKQRTVSYIEKDHDGNEWREIIKEPVLIGSKYIMVLCKTPSMDMYAVSLAYVNQFELPSKSNARKRGESHVSTTPIRVLGEDETALGIMSIPDDEFPRLFGLQGTCPEAVRNLGHRLLTDDKPTCLRRIDMSTEEIMAKSVPVRMIHHILGFLGTRVMSDRVVKREKEKNKCEK